MAFFSKGNSTTASPYKAIIKSPCRVRITYKAIHTVFMSKYYSYQYQDYWR